MTAEHDKYGEQIQSLKVEREEFVVTTNLPGFL